MITDLSNRHDPADPSLELAGWLCANTPRLPDELTHLKLQKLAFYCYGALLAFDLDSQVGDIAFEAWKHGPVSPKMYQEYSAYGRQILPKPSQARRYLAAVESVLRQTTNVYGRMTAWQLREESHTETPWEANYDGMPNKPLAKESIRAHFRTKFRGPVVSFPERLFGASSMLLDRIPVPTFSSFADMSTATTQILGEIA
jgi:uncharacterized phage-associated protein